ncbi:MAG: ABC transporter permease [Bdellovibrionales bacterium]|nr:ABC transporter permease [Bdellovibrionales bacterium]
MRLLSILTLNQLKTRKLRNGLSLLGICFGVALYTSIDLVNESTLQSFRSGIEAMSGKATLSVLGGPSGFPESVLGKIEGVPGVASAVPIIETQAYYTPTGTASTQTIMILGVDLLRESSVRAYQVRDGGMIDDPLSFLNQPDSIILTTKFADLHGLQVGDTISISTASGPRRFAIRGLLTPEGPAKAYGGNLGIMDIDAARLQFGKGEKLDRVDILPRPGFSQKEIQERLEDALPKTLSIESPASQAGSMRRLVEGYQGLLSFIGSLSLIVGLFLVLNSMTIALAERRRELGILRAIGADRRFLMRNLLEEGFAIGFTGSILGLLLGRWVAGGMVGLISQALSNQYLIPVFVDQLVITPILVLKSLGLGTLTTLIATAIAGRKGLDVAPLEAVRGHNFEPYAPGWLAPVSGIMLLGFIVLDARAGLSHGMPLIRILNPFCLIFGAVLASPLFVRILIRVVRALIPSSTLRLACENLLRNARRTTSNLMTLMTGLMLVMVLSLLNGSIKHSVLSWFRNTLSADLVVSSTGKLLSFQVQPLSESLRDDLNRIEGVDVSEGIGVTGLRYVKQIYEGKTLAIKAFDKPHPKLRNALIEVKDGGNPEDVRAAFFESVEPVALVSENFVLHFRKKSGEWIELQTPTGSQFFRILGVVSEFTNPEGVIYLNRTTYKKLYMDDLVSGFFVMAQPGITPLELRSNLDRTLGKTMGLMATLNSELNRDAEKIVDESFSYTRAIEWSALLVGLFGLFNTVLVSVLDRRREFGVLRAIGMNKTQLIQMVLGESMLQGTLGGIVSIGIAVFVCYFWVMGTLSSLMGWVLTFSIPAHALWKTFFAGLGAGILAGVLPGIRASEVPIRESLESS